MKKFVCAEVEPIDPGSTGFKLVHATLLDAENYDAKDIRSYIEFYIKTSPFFEGKVVLDNINFVEDVPEGLIVVGNSDGYPLIACWEAER